VRPNTGFQPTPLRGPKIGAILKVGISSTAFLIERAARLKPKALDGSMLFQAE
jgi:hypothetical protein